MFDDVQQIPLSLKAVQLVLGTALDRQSGFDRSPQALAMKRLRAEPRWRVKVLGNLQPSVFDKALREFWYEHLAKMFSQPSLSGLVWIRDDVVLEDHQLFERLSESWVRERSLVIRDATGAVLLWALSIEGVRSWMRWYAEKHSGEALTPPVKTGKEIAAQMRAAVEDGGGSFPQADIAAAVLAGVQESPWVVGLSVLRINAGAPAQVVPLTASQNALDHLPPLRVVCATRESQERFLTHTLTGQSLNRMKHAGIDIRTTVICANQSGLPSIYNKVIHQDNSGAILLFVHDDVWINDLWLAQRLHEGLLRYDVLGVAGSRQRVPNQPGWPFPQRSGTWDIPDNLLGQVAHCADEKYLDHANAKVSRYGNSRRGPARLMDGVLLAARCDVLLKTGVRFDERFQFHFYDMDFCRTAEQRGLRMGVWPMAITHGSAGRFGGQEWLASYGTYIGKWQD